MVRLIDDPRFDQFIIFCILIGSVMLTLDRPGTDDLEGALRSLAPSLPRSLARVVVGQSWCGVVWPRSWPSPLPEFVVL